MNTFFLVNNMASFQTMKDQMSEFLAARVKNAVLESPLGIWLCPGWPRELPFAELPPGKSSATHRGMRIQETAGLEGFWTLCWLATRCGETCDEPGRLELLGALIDSPDLGSQGASAGRFIPIFPCHMAPSIEANEMTQLESQYPQYLMPPVFQDLVTARLFSRER